MWLTTIWVSKITVEKFTSGMNALSFLCVHKPGREDALFIVLGICRSSLAIHHPAILGNRHVDARAAFGVG